MFIKINRFHLYLFDLHFVDFTFILYFKFLALSHSSGVNLINMVFMFFYSIGLFCLGDSFPLLDDRSALDLLRQTFEVGERTLSEMSDIHDNLLLISFGVSPLPLASTSLGASFSITSGFFTLFGLEILRLTSMTNNWVSKGFISGAINSFFDDLGAGLLLVKLYIEERSFCISI